MRRSSFAARIQVSYAACTDCHGFSELAQRSQRWPDARRAQLSIVNMPNESSTSFFSSLRPPTRSCWYERIRGHPEDEENGTTERLHFAVTLSSLLLLPPSACYSDQSCCVFPPGPFRLEFAVIRRVSFVKNLKSSDILLVIIHSSY